MLILTLYLKVSHTILFYALFLPWSLSMHLTVWLHCLEELEGLVHVMALSVLTYRGATILQPSEGPDTATVH